MIHLVVRQTLDWLDEDAFRAQLPPHLGAMVSLWDDTFTMPFHAFRHRVKAIAESSWSAIEGVKRCPLADVPEGSLVVPTDDDDWFSPQLVTMLTAEQSNSQEALGFRWPSRFLEVPLTRRHRLGALRRVLFPSTPPRHLCTTNNYAMVKQPDTGSSLGNHLTASRWFAENSNETRVLGGAWSVMNRTLGSQTTFRYLPKRGTRAALLRKYRRYVELYRQPLPADLAWCAPQVDRMDRLMRELRPRN